MRRRPALVLCSLIVVSGTAPAQNLLYDLTESSGTSIDQQIGACGDVNGDGLPDFLIGLPNDDTLGTNAGVMRVHSGPNAAVLFEIFGDAQQEELGFALDGAGDVNADGFPDFMSGSGHVGSGLARVWSGANGSLLYDLSGSPGEAFGNAVSGVGDMDLDGHDDFAVSAPSGPLQPGVGPGYASVYSGLDGGQILHWSGDCVMADFGESLDGVGDTNGDGLPDMAVYQPSEQAACPGVVKLFSPLGAILHTIPVDSELAVGPYGVAHAGDVDGDGHPDVVVGNPGSSSGCSSSIPGNVSVYSGLTGALLLDVDGETGCTWLGWSVDGVGDLNGDGHDDVAAGSIGTDRVDVYSGSDESLLLRIESPTDGNYGYGLAGLGDLNGDGMLEIGAVGIGAGAWVHSECPGETSKYGLGCDGSNDFVPKLSVTGCPNPGQKLVFHITAGFGGQPAFLAFGTGAGAVLLAGSCKLLVSPLIAVAPVGMLFDFGPGWGNRDVPVAVPPGTGGMVFTVQEANVDPFVPTGFAVSNAVRVEVQ